MSESKTILGIMSGTSLDGLDFALCRFKSSSLAYDYEIIKTGFYPYDLQTKKKLSEAQKLNAYEFILFHKQYGKYIGQKAKCFLKNEVTPDIIASHGHTVFHKPQEQITFQIGDAAFISAETGIPVISDFRNLDTALKGQGAPLVPAGDKLLFPEYDICLNLGGFANISYDDDSGKRKAFDVSPFNFIINNLVKPLNKEYDKDGEIGKTGKINISLLSELDNIPYYKEQMPKSLGREYVESYFFPVLDSYNIPFKDKIRTFYEHAAYKISESMNVLDNAKVLITGGGTHNSFFISLLKKYCKHNVTIPEKQIIDFKEAIIFAFLGYLRKYRKINTFSSVTGAEKDSSGGSIFII